MLKVYLGFSWLKAYFHLRSKVVRGLSRCLLCRIKWWWDPLSQFYHLSSISVYMSPLIKQSSLACGLFMGCLTCSVLECVNKIRTLGRDFIGPKCLLWTLVACVAGRKKRKGREKCKRFECEVTTSSASRGHLGIFWVGMRRLGLQIGIPF